MAKKLLSIGTVNLVEDQGIQKIEIVPHGDFDLMKLIEAALQLNQSVSVPDLKDLGVYLEDLLTNLKLPITIYRQNTYRGIRSNINNTTLMYWNYNNRSQYLNISPKSEILDSFTEVLKFKQEEVCDLAEPCPYYQLDEFTVFWREGGKQKFKEQLTSIFKSYEETNKQLSHFLLTYNHDHLERQNFNALKTSLNPEWWKSYAKEYALLDEDYYHYYPEKYEAPWGEPLDSKYDYLEQYPDGPFLDFKPIMNKIFEERLAIKIDKDKRFPRTSRIRLISKQEIDEFFDYLAPQLELSVRSE